MNSSTFRVGLSRSWPFLALLLIAVVWLYRTPYSASNLEVPPDTVEYALAPLQLLETGRYEIMVEGRGLPPRYPPWFPILVILPSYVLFGHDPGNAILGITLLAVAGIGCAYAIGSRIGSTIGGVLAALTVLAVPSYSRWATQVMTDVPCTALMLGAGLLYLNLRTKPEPTLLYFGAGVLVAIATLFRVTFAAMLLPFALALLRQRKDVFRRGLALVTPMVVATAATFAYNASVFGSPLRNGYNFWVPLPMDYPGMVLSLSYLRMNLGEIGLTAFSILLPVCICAWLLTRIRHPAVVTGSRQSLQDAFIFFSLTTVPILLFHLFYFFSSDRFHIPIMTGIAVLAGSMLALFIGPRPKITLKALLPLVFGLTVAARIAAPGPLPLRRIAAERVRNHTPDNAIVISAIDPVYLARMAASGSSRRIVPLSRNVEYAGALLVRRRVENPRLRSLNWEDPQTHAVLRSQAEEAIQFVASERMDEVEREAVQGTPVFFESSFVDDEAQLLAQLQTHFKVVRRAPYLYQLQSR